MAVGGWPLFFCGGHAFEFYLGVFFTCQVEPKGFVIHVGQDVNTFFPSLFAVVGFAGLDLGVFIAVAATLILVFVRANSEDFNRLFALVDEGEFYFVNGFFFCR